MKLQDRPLLRGVATTTLLLMAAAAPVLADVIPYPNPGTIAPAYTFSANLTGQINAYFYGSSAAGTDYIDVVDITKNIATGWIFNNHGTSMGQEATLFGVQAGDSIEFWLENLSLNQGILTSNPGDSADGMNHAYATVYSAMGSTAIVGIPRGLYIGLEDLAKINSDLDYDDDTFVVTNVSLSSSAITPEPTSAILVGTGTALIAVMRRRRVS